MYRRCFPLWEASAREATCLRCSSPETQRLPLNKLDCSLEILNLDGENLDRESVEGGDKISKRAEIAASCCWWTSEFSAAPAVYDSFNRRSPGEIKFLRRRALRRGRSPNTGVIYHLKFYESFGRRRNKILRVSRNCSGGVKDCRSVCRNFILVEFEKSFFFFSTLRKWIFVYLWNITINSIFLLPSEYF